MLICFRVVCGCFWQSWMVMTETTWLTRPTIFALCPWQEHFTVLPWALCPGLKFPFGARAVPWVSACFARRGKGSCAWGDTPHPPSPASPLWGLYLLLALTVRLGGEFRNFLKCKSDPLSISLLLNAPRGKSTVFISALLGLAPVSFVSFGCLIFGNLSFLPSLN